ncbi:bifunctional folylpolyglutamate synthase/dihydrofolate synthase [Lacticaseibacillus porcinae]|uniref:bifunctional folylpolyglutamate synthase/dihydrofolate synthase n=1 Tax=Lacticaseibacillus porcinae TaxID=1123687 RepID=UPI000F78D9FF|nr:Mur ligase family protein [Lacticaseibacillus porcinae]
MATVDYQSLRVSMDHRMLAADPKRVEALRSVLHQIGDPDLAFHVIHIAGTNGKGSTGAFIAQALRNAGHVVGHFASPAIHDELDQSKIGSQSIADSEYATLMLQIMQQAQLSPDAFTDFEWDVLVTLAWFAQQHCDWVVLEAGLGGATDATNAISAPDLAVFTHIALDHTAILGDTIEKIATNKAQIIKAGTQVVVASHQAPEALTTIRAVAQAHHAAGVIDASDVVLTPMTTIWTGTSAELANGRTVMVRMLGAFQLANAQTAIAVGQWLVANHALTSISQVFDALKTVQLPGRMEVIQHDPIVIVDAGHNPDAFPQALGQVRQLLPTGGRLLLVAGFLKDKAVAELAKIAQTADQVWVTTPSHPTRALAGEQLQAMIPGAQFVDSVQAGRNAAVAAAKPEDVVLVAGSFYLIGGLLP